MQSEAVAKRYAWALLELAQSEGSVDTFAKDLENFDELLVGCEELRVVLSNPSIPLEQRQNVIKMILDQMDISRLPANFIRLLVDRRRIQIFRLILNAYYERSDELSGRLRGTVTSAFELTELQEERLNGVISKMLSLEVTLTPVLDPDLIGGLRIEVGGKTYDSSIRGQLNRMRENLSS